MTLSNTPEPVENAEDSRSWLVTTSSTRKTVGKKHALRTDAGGGDRGRRHDENDTPIHEGGQKVGQDDKKGLDAVRIDRRRGRRVMTAQIIADHTLTLTHRVARG